MTIISNKIAIFDFFCKKITAFLKNNTYSEIFSIFALLSTSTQRGSHENE